MGDVVSSHPDHPEHTLEQPLTHEDFAPHVGKQFTFKEHSIPLRLASVDLRPRPGYTRTPFTLLFHGPVNVIVPPGLYQTVLPDGLDAELHIMPVNTIERDRQDYQAVFN
jgi:hypothetical protein